MSEEKKNRIEKLTEDVLQTFTEQSVTLGEALEVADRIKCLLNHQSNCTKVSITEIRVARKQCEKKYKLTYSFPNPTP